MNYIKLRPLGKGLLKKIHNNNINKKRDILN